MKAIVQTRYGSPDILELRDVARPVPKRKEVLVKVLAASVNKADWHMLTGQPFPVRLAGGLFKPKYPILGADIAGIVARTGSDVTQFKPGDEVYGDLSGAGFGGFAEYVARDEQWLAKKPDTLSFEEATALPMSAVAALQGLRNIGRIRSGQDVLINGASGGVGGFAIQIAKAFDTHVTAVCCTRKLDNAREQGADQVIDYTVQHFTKADKQYDLIFDVVGNHSVQALGRVLKPGGTVACCAFSTSAVLPGPWKSLTEKKRMRNFHAKNNMADLQFICKLAEEGKLKPVIEKTYSLDGVPEALHAIGNGGLRGKLVIVI